MTRFSTRTKQAIAALLIGSSLVLAGCHRGSTKGEVAAAEARGQFDAVIKAYKGGQFLVDGAVLSALDTGSHFAYLKDVGQLPKTVLLAPSDDTKVRKQHLQFMARMQLDYGFVAYYDDGGVLKKINPQETKARRLEDYHAPTKLNDEQRGKSAAGSTMDDRQQGY